MIPVYKPWLTNKEKNYLNEAFDSGWISSRGDFIQKFEEKLASIFKVNHAIAISNGTAACHLAIKSTDNEGATIIIPATSYVATANAAKYENLPIKFIDMNLRSWAIDVEKLESFCQNDHNKKILFLAYIYSYIPNISEILRICETYSVTLIEDACEAFYCKTHDGMVGTFGECGVFSFFGNKTLTTGEGGAIITNDSGVKDKIGILKNQGQLGCYYHPMVGYNYRMTNLQAAIGLAQLERLDEILEEKQRVNSLYCKKLSNYSTIKIPKVNENAWMFAISTSTKQKILAAFLEKKGIDTRPIFFPLPKLPHLCESNEFPVADHLHEYGIVLPSYPTLTNREIDYICEQVIRGSSYEI